MLVLFFDLQDFVIVQGYFCISKTVILSAVKSPVAYPMSINHAFRNMSLIYHIVNDRITGIC